MDSKETLRSWLLSELAAVLLSSKSGELLNFNFKILPYSRHELHLALDEIAKKWSCSLRQMCSCETTEKWLVYYPKRVDKALENLPEEILSRSLSYQSDLCCDTFLDEVASRWRSQKEIPHEIGFALGYPIKDVLGYLGLNDLPCSGNCGWCIFGDAEYSKQKSVEYQQAKSFALRVLHEETITYTSQRCAHAALLDKTKRASAERPTALR